MPQRCSSCGGTMRPAPADDILAQMLGGTPGHTVWKCTSCGNSFLRQGGPGDSSRRATASPTFWVIGLSLLCIVAIFAWQYWGKQRPGSVESLYRGLLVVRSLGFWLLVAASAFISYQIEVTPRRHSRSPTGSLAVLFARPLTISIGVAVLLPRLSPSWPQSGLHTIWSHFVAVGTAALAAFLFLMVTNMIPRIGWLMSKQSIQIYVEGLAAIVLISHGSIYPGLLLTIALGAVALSLSYTLIGLTGLFVIKLGRHNRRKQNFVGDVTSLLYNSISGLLALSLFAASAGG